MAELATRPAILDRLKQETRVYHLALESHLAFLTEDVTVGPYRKLLAAFYGFYLPWEDAIRPWREEIFGEAAPAREKTASLIEDLSFFEVAIDCLPICCQTPPADGLPAALGNLYVMEGATLGGRLIALNVERSLQLSGYRGYKFFSSYGINAGPMWRAFRKALTDLSTRANEEKIIDSATAAFKSMRAWLMKEGF